MIKNYLVVTLRNLIKNKVFTLLNIIGLGIALSVCIVAFFNHMFNYSFDRTHENFNKIYRVTCFRDMQGREQEYGIAPATLGLNVKKEIPGIYKSARLIKSTSPVKEGDDIFSTRISYVDPDFLDIFTFPIILGDKKSIEKQGNVLISRKMASALFGKEFPVGKTISIVNDNNKEFTYTVGAVYEDLPQNSSFRIDILTHFDNYMLMWDVTDSDWKLWTTALFIQADKKTVHSVTQSLRNYIPVQNKAREDFKINRFNLIPLKDVGESNRKIWSSGLFPSLHPAALISPSVMAIFILLIACFNFANTSIAAFSKRLKEIGLRKTFGGQRHQLVIQFMFETLIVCLAALFVGIALAEFLVPAYSSLWSYMSLKMTFAGYGFFWIFLFLLLLLTGFISGVYPAFYVSSLSPINVFKDFALFKGTGKFSSVLLALQFTISVTALVMGIVFAKNSQFQKTVDLGYDRDEIIVIRISPELFTSFRNELITNPKIISASGTENHIGFSGNYRLPLKDNEKQLEVDVLDIGPGYAQTMGLRLAEGRFFDENRVAADRAGSLIVVNRKFVNDFGWKEAIGKTVTLDDTTKLTVIGVVEDFYLEGVWQAVEPVMLRLSQTDRYHIMAVKARPEDLSGVLEFISSGWKSLSSNLIFNGRFQNDLMQEGQNINDSIMKVNIFLAIIATILSLIGMYNLVSLDIIRRTKEIGIRKIQGAPVLLIMFLVSRRFLIILLIASLLGAAGGYKMSVMLMDSIWDYFVSIKFGVLMIAVLVMVLATLFTIIFKVMKAAMKNPVISLRYE